MQLLNDVSRVIAVVYTGLITFGLAALILYTLMVAHPPSANLLSLLAYDAEFCILAFLLCAGIGYFLGHRLLLWTVGASTLFFFSSFRINTHFPADASVIAAALAALIIFTAIFGYMLWSIGMAGVRAAEKSGSDKHLDEWPYWRVVAITCACISLYSCTAGRNAALDTVRSRVGAPGKRAEVLAVHNLLLPVIFHTKKDRSVDIYCFDPAGRIVLAVFYDFD